LNFERDMPNNVPLELVLFQLAVNLFVIFILVVFYRLNPSQSDRFFIKTRAQFLI